MILLDTSVLIDSLTGTRRSARALRTPRGREVAIAIAAGAICWDAQMWTLNTGDFHDIPGSDLFRPA